MHDSKAEHLRECSSVLNPTVKGRLQSLLHIGSAHNERGPTEIFLNLNTGIHSFMSKANQNSARHLVSASYFTNIAVQHINQAILYKLIEFLENEIPKYVMKYP